MKGTDQYKKIVYADIKELLAKNRLDYQELKDRTVLVTGACGMLARFLVYTFMYLNQYKGMNITVLALARTQKKAQEYFAPFLEDKHFRLLLQDVCIPVRMDGKIDYIIHAAGAASPRFIKSDPMSIIMANTIGTINVTELARNCSCRKLLYLSTREVYGKVTGTDLIHEEDMGILDPMDGRSCYPESKRMSEQILKSCYLQHGVNFTIARLAHVYGPGMDIQEDGRVMSDFISDAVNGHNIILKSDGMAIRSFCYVADAAAALLTLISDGKNGEAYNISNETEPMTIRDTAELIVKLCPNGKIKAEFQVDKDQTGYCAYKRVALSTDKIEMLGWKPKTSIQTGIGRTLESFL